jgi:gliding motility-associated-like protein
MTFQRLFLFMFSAFFACSLTYGQTEEPTDDNGTETNDSIVVSHIEIPNGFSPNGDDINDKLCVKSSSTVGITEFRAIIYNRWGQKLYEWTDINDGWDGTYNGKPVKQGTYFVLVKAKGADGKTHTIKRDVNLLRGYLNDGQQ